MSFFDLPLTQCSNTAHPPHHLHDICTTCRSERLELEWLQMHHCEWDMQTPIAVHGQPVTLYTPEEVTNYCCAIGCTDAATLPRFVLCQSVPIPHVSPIDALHGWLDPACPVPAAVRNAFAALNAELARSKPVAWRPGSTRVSFPEVFLDHLATAGNPVATA